MSIENLTALLAEFGGTIELPDLKPDEAGFCLLIFDSEIRVQISHEAEEEAFNLSSPLGDLPPRAAEFSSRMLQANFFGELTRGSTLCLAPDETSVYLWQRRTLAGLDYPHFEKILRDFVEASAYWKTALAKASEQSAAAQVPEPGSITV